MTVDGNLIITSYKVNEEVNEFGRTVHTVKFYDKDKNPVFTSKMEEPMARIRHILPVRLNYVFDGEKARATGFLPLRENEQNLQMEGN